MRFPKSPHEEESPNARLCSFHPGKTKQLDTRIKNITIQQTQNLNEMTQRCKIRQILVWKHLGAVSSLQLFPVIRQVAFALPANADQLPGRLEAPAGAAPRAGQAGVLGGALGILLPAWPGWTVTRGVP